MKKIAAALLLAVIAVPAYAVDYGYYAGVNAGRSKVDSTIGNTALTRTDDTSYGLLLGYQFNPNFAMELQYTDLGDFEVSPVSGKDNVWALALVGSVPVADAFSLYGKLGYANTRSSLSAGPASGTNRSAVTYGLGAQYDFTPEIGMRLGWDQYNAAVNDGAGNSQNYKISNWNIGLIARF